MHVLSHRKGSFYVYQSSTGLRTLFILSQASDLSSPGLSLRVILWGLREKLIQPCNYFNWWFHELNCWIVDTLACALPLSFVDEFSLFITRLLELIGLSIVHFKYEQLCWTLNHQNILELFFNHPFYPEYLCCICSRCQLFGLLHCLFSLFLLLLCGNLWTFVKGNPPSEYCNSNLFFHAGVKKFYHPLAFRTTMSPSKKCGTIWIVWQWIGIYLHELKISVLL